MRDLRRAGARTVVDCTCVGLSQDPEALARIAKASGVNIIASVGLYRGVVYPDYVATESTDQIAVRFIDAADANAWNDRPRRAGYELPEA